MARISADRLQQLKVDIAAGCYHPDSRAVAEKLLERWYRLHGGGTRADSSEEIPGGPAPSAGRDRDDAPR